MISAISSPPGESPIVLEDRFNATPERLFRAWTRPEQLRKWFGSTPAQIAEIELDLKVGGKWRFGMSPTERARSHLEGEYLEIVPAERLVFTWAHVTETADGQVSRTPQSQVTVTFKPDGAQTRLVLRHEAIVSADGRLGVRDGWLTSFAGLHDLVKTPA